MQFGKWINMFKTQSKTNKVACQNIKAAFYCVADI